MYVKPLHGVKVLELASFIAGPSCARFLADMGADIIKVEPSGGDPLRYFASNEGRPTGDQEDTTFTLENSGKRCITLNTKSAEGRKALEILLASADVLITNWRRPALLKNDLDYETLKAKYPALVVGHISGYGEKGPDCAMPGFDFTAYFARGGILGTMYAADTSPMTPIAGFGDQQAGMFLAAGVLAALYRARETGRGDYVSVSLFHAALWDTALGLQNSQYGHDGMHYPYERRQMRHPLKMAYQTADGRWIQLYAEDKFESKLSNLPLSAQPACNLYDRLTAFMASRTSEEALEFMEQAGIYCELCRTWTEVLADKQAWASEALTHVRFPNGKERAMVRIPVQLKNTENDSCERGPFLGEHTREILSEAGYSQSQIEAMILAGDAGDLTRLD